ncbi:AAA family ATPase [Geomonas nitrogeniifigens]|uniref:AAA family ATPase n=1 Tax=Geomonas diazotrophica TaxID=2843197 RepID=A0ABX8JG46_9BACT|nr:AAA family ATPase [Geomonas nitrogeniifigens]QWV97360.1 AAA family ATPase [Geomonas nitrogeniifigens]QXE86518.1 AAA family ATPase [Geomonas nitrogeniifigens]
MARKIFVAASGQNIGKTTISVSLLHLAQKKYGRVGFMKPLGPKPTVLRGIPVDKDAALMAQVFGLTKDLRYMSPVVVYPETSREAIDGKLNLPELADRIMTSFAELEKHCDFIVIEGSGHPGVGTVLRLSNARIAKMLDAPVLMLSGGGVGNVIDTLAMNTALFKLEGADVRGVLVNKLFTEKRDTMLDYLTRAFADQPFSVLGGFDYKPVLANPSLGRVARLLDLPLYGNRREVKRIIHHVQIGAASTQRVTEMLSDSSLLLVTSSRDELLVTIANLYQMPEFHPLIAGLIISGQAPVSNITQRIVDRSNIPYFRTNQTTTDIYKIITEDVSKLTAKDTEKLDLIRSLAEERLDFDAIDELFAQ